MPENGTKNKKTEYEYRCIDGNWTRHPEAFCNFHKGVLTRRMMKVHRCNEKNCPRLITKTQFE